MQEPKIPARALPVEAVMPTPPLVDQPQPPPETVAAGIKTETAKSQQEAKPASGNWTPEKFGVMGKDAKREIRETRAIKAMYEPLLSQVAIQLQEFAALKSRKHPLSEEQLNFLKLWEKQESGGGKIMDTEVGAMLASSMVKQEVFMRFIATSKNIELTKSGWKKDDLKLQRNVRLLTSPFNLKMREYADYIQRFADKLRTGVKINADGNIEMTPLAGVEIDSLPAIYKEYIEYSMAAADPKGTTEFMLDAAEAEIELRYSLGEHPKNWSSLMPWDKLDLTNKSTMPLSPEDFGHPVISSDVRVMMDLFREQGGFAANELTPKKKLEYFFKSLSGTAAEFSNRLLDGIDKTPETSSSVGKTISKLRERNEMAVDPVKRQRAVERKEEEKKTWEAKKTTAKTKFDENEAKLSEQTRQLEDLRNRKSDLESEIVELSEEITKKKPRQQELETAIKKRKDYYLDERQKIRDSNQRDKAVLFEDLDKQQREEEELQNNIKELNLLNNGDNSEEGLVEKEKSLKAKRKDLANEPKMEKAIARIKGEQALLDRDLKEYSKEIHNLDDEIEAGAKTQADKEIIGRREAAIQALGREGEIHSELNSKPDEYNLDYFADTRDNTILSAKLNHPVTMGYSKFLELIFDPEHPQAKMSEAELWKHALEILPEKVLAETLAISLDASPGYMNFTLKDVFNVMKSKSSKISLLDIRKTMDLVMQSVERSSRLI